MAEIPAVRINIGSPYPDGQRTKVDVGIEFDIVWSRSDRVSQQVYQGDWEVYGKDTFAQEDGQDDHIIGKGAVSVLEYSANGSGSSTERVDFTTDWSRLDEDSVGWDEIFAEVTLTPVGPKVVTATSPHVNVIAS